jgi:CelD/BcsL family acetyltransferase involved in cellulose biosynthesis
MTAPAPIRSAPKPCESSAPAQDWWVEAVEERSALARRKPAWDALAANAVETNVFLEPWRFLPAAEFFETDKPLCCVFVYRRAPRPEARPILCGFFPFERRRRYRKLPIRTLRLWDAAHVLLTPLVHREHARQTLHYLFDWAVREGRCSLVEMPMIHGEGPFHQALIDVLNERRMPTFVEDTCNRAMIRRGRDAESYFADTLDPESLRNWRRLRRRLSEQGKLELRSLHANDDVDRWLQQFLTLEASGWKGRERTAVKSTVSSEAIFRASSRNAFALGKLQMLGLFLDGRPIALKCNYLSGSGGFTYKIAYDESFARFSPGVLLELDNIEEMHRRPDVQWLDSCAAPDHFMMNRLWKDRRTLQHLVLATSRWVGNGVVGLLPLLRSLKRMIRP